MPIGVLETPMFLERMSVMLEFMPVRLERPPMNRGSAEAKCGPPCVVARSLPPHEHAETPLAGDVPR